MQFTAGSFMGQKLTDNPELQHMATRSAGVMTLTLLPALQGNERQTLQSSLRRGWLQGCQVTAADDVSRACAGCVVACLTAQLAASPDSSKLTGAPATPAASQAPPLPAWHPDGLHQLLEQPWTAASSAGAAASHAGSAAPLRQARLLALQAQLVAFCTAGLQQVGA